MKASAHTRRTHTARQGSTGSGLCVTCALRRHDFREVMGSVPDGDCPSEASGSQARIDGVRHVLRSASGCRTCDDCGRNATHFYIPIE
jgi:hypothetical protein